MSSPFLMATVGRPLHSLVQSLSAFRAARLARLPVHPDPLAAQMFVEAVYEGDVEKVRHMFPVMGSANWISRVEHGSPGRRRVAPLDPVSALLLDGRNLETLDFLLENGADVNRLRPLLVHFTSPADGNVVYAPSDGWLGRSQLLPVAFSLVRYTSSGERGYADRGGRSHGIAGETLAVLGKILPLCNKDTLTFQDMAGNTLLHYLARMEVAPDKADEVTGWIGWCVAHGASLDVKNRAGETPCFFAEKGSPGRMVLETLAFQAALGQTLPARSPKAATRL